MVCDAPRLRPGSFTNRRRRVESTSAVTSDGDSWPPSGRSRRRNCTGIWKSSRSGRATTSGTAQGRREPRELWGQLLHAVALPAENAGDVLKAWDRVDGHAGRRFSVLVDAAPEAGATESAIEEAPRPPRSCSAYHGSCSTTGTVTSFKAPNPPASPAALPNTRPELEVPVVATPIRILLVTARPEDEACGYIDHRAMRCHWSKRWKRSAASSSSMC